MKRKTNVMIVVGGILVVVLLYVALNPLALIIDDPGGGGEPTPPPPPPDPDPYDIPDPITPPSTPTLELITPNPDTDGSVNLRWNVVSGAVGYRVYMSKDLGVWQLIKTTVYIAYLKAGLTNGNYRFRVNAYSTTGVSAYSTIRSVTVSIPIIIPPPPPPPGPIPPTPPTLNRIHPDPDPDGSIALSWSMPIETIGFKIYRSVNGKEYVQISRSTFTQYTDNNLDNGVYYYKVQAYNDAGTSEYSNIVFVRVEVPLLPSVPILNSIPSPDTDGFITLSWGDSIWIDAGVSMEDGFEVYRSVNGGSFMFFKDLTSTTLQVSEANGDYSYKVRAYNEAGFSDYSNIVSVKVVIPEVLPPVPIEPTETEPPFTIYNMLILILVSATIVVSAILLSKFLKKQVRQIKSNQK